MTFLVDNRHSSSESQTNNEKKEEEEEEEAAPRPVKPQRPMLSAMPNCDCSCKNAEIWQLSKPTG